MGTFISILRWISLSVISEVQFLTSLLQELMRKLDGANEHYLTIEVAVGYFAMHLPNYADTTCIVYVTEMCYKVRGFMTYCIPGLY
jgi:hypothetical protein